MTIHKKQQKQTASLINVLLVENDPSIVSLISEMLVGKKGGTKYKITVTDNLKRSFLVPKQKRIDVILLDLDSINSIGVELLNKINKNFSNMPVVVITGLLDKEKENEISRLGAPDYLIKSELTSENVVKTIQHALERFKFLRDIKFEHDNFADFVKTINLIQVDLNSMAQKKKMPNSKCMAHVAVLQKKAKQFSDIMTKRESLLLNIQDKNIRLEKLATHDLLTSLPNRLQFEATLERNLAQASRHKRLLCLFFLDLDGFKKVNDKFGHDVGDLLLIEVAKRFRMVLRKEDFITRIGGDEFAIILSDIKSIQQAEVVAKKIIAAINKPFQISNKEIFVGVSIGVSLYPNSSSDWRNLVKDADVAMYRAKQEGRNTFRYVASPTVSNDQLEQKNVKLLKKIQKQNLKLAHVLSHDLLTGLPNRFELEKVLKSSVAAAKKHNYLLGLLCLGLDNFKSINDGLGYDIGDLLLKEVVKRICLCAGKKNFVARLGGDEFAIILPKIKAMDDAGIMADKIRAKVLEPYNINGREVFVSTSVGISGYPKSGANWKDLLKDADIAMHHAKQVGQNTSQYMSASDNAMQIYQFLLENKLRFALERKEFFLMYQPFVELKTGKMVGMEVLLRWQQASVIMPNDFIPIAERLGLIDSIGEWVLQTSCKQYQKWFGEKHCQNQYLLAINLSARQLGQNKLLQTIKKVLDQENISVENISLELTETAIMQNEAEAKKVLEQLHKMGAKIVIDDFGIGYSSLSRLGHLPIHMLKIDKSFVQNIGIDASDEIIIKSTIALAHNLGLQVLAEGVETETQRKFLMQNDCTYAQGYLFSKPLTVEQMTQFIAEQKEV